MKKIVKVGKKRFFAHFFKDGFELNGVFHTPVKINSYLYFYVGKDFRATVRKWWELKREGKLQETRYS